MSTTYKHAIAIGALAAGLNMVGIDATVGGLVGSTVGEALPSNFGQAFTFGAVVGAIVLVYDLFLAEKVMTMF